MEMPRTISGTLSRPLPAMEHVVFALTPEEKELFFSTDLRLSKPSVQESWLDTRHIASGHWEESLRRLRPTVLVTAWSCPPLPLTWIREAGCPLRYLCSVTGSVRPRVPREIIEKGLIVTNWGSLVGPAVAEHAMLMALSLLRGQAFWPELINAPRSMFKMMPKLRSRTLRGKKVGLHGFGAVARELVSMLQPYGVDIAAWSPGVPVAMLEEFGARPCSGLGELFSSSEVLFECEGLNEQSRGSVTEEILRLLPEDAVFVNVGRGAVVDENALAVLAGEGRLRVGLDVFQCEPLPSDSPLRGNPRVLLSPHVAGPTWETYPLCGAQAMENLTKYLSGEQPENRVTPEIYDRAT